MSDLVTKLREPVTTFTGKMRDYPDGRTEGPFHPLMLEAADRIEALEKERDEARQIVRDIHWMARRYADGRMSYAVEMFNDAVKKAFDGGWLEVSHDEPAYAVDGADRHRKPSEAEGREAE